MPGGQLYQYDPATGRTVVFADLPAKRCAATSILDRERNVWWCTPHERFLYYVPGAHGRAFRYGTPVIQYEITTGHRKVIAFLAAAIEEKHGYVPAGTYGVKLNADGSTLYVNFNGHAADSIRPAHMRPNGFGLCAFAAIHIPEGARQ